MTARAPRSRLVYLGLLGATITLGLATRRVPFAFPDVVARYGGDTLWAAMVLWLLALWRRTATTTTLAVSAMLIAFAVELSQLHHASWLDALRATRLGALALGQGFLWSDLVCYAVGALLAAVLDAGIGRRARSVAMSERQHSPTGVP